MIVDTFNLLVAMDIVLILSAFAVRIIEKNVEMSVISIILAGLSAYLSLFLSMISVNGSVEVKTVISGFNQSTNALYHEVISTPVFMPFLSLFFGALGVLMVAITTYLVILFWKERVEEVIE